MRKLFLLFFGLRGRIGRSQFIGGVAAFLGFYLLQALWFASSGPTPLNFWLSMVLLVLNLWVIIALYGKRLRDMGQNLWVLTGMFATIILLAVFVMLASGGLEYFDALYNNAEIVGDAARMKHLQERYQETMTQNMPRNRLIFAALPLLFTLWLALAPGQSSK